MRAMGGERGLPGYQLCSLPECRVLLCAAGEMVWSASARVVGASASGASRQNGAHITAHSQRQACESVLVGNSAGTATSWEPPNVQITTCPPLTGTELDASRSLKDPYMDMNKTRASLKTACRFTGKTRIRSMCALRDESPCDKVARSQEYQRYLHFCHAERCISLSLQRSSSRL